MEAARCRRRSRDCLRDRDPRRRGPPSPADRPDPRADLTSGTFRAPLSL